MSTPTKPKAQSLPHSWRVADWPPGVTPNRQNAAKHLVRTHRDELIEVGALVRIGRDLTVLGEGFARFLSRRLGHVNDFDMPPNRDREPAQLDLFDSTPEQLPLPLEPQS